MTIPCRPNKKREGLTTIGDECNRVKLRLAQFEVQNISFHFNFFLELLYPNERDEDIVWTLRKLRGIRATLVELFFMMNQLQTQLL